MDDAHTDETLVHSLWRTAKEDPNREAVRSYPDRPRDADPVVLSYGELDRRARALAAHLNDANPRGSRVVLAYPNTTEFCVAFFGCLYAGMVPVPAPLPFNPRGSRFSRLRGIVTASEASAVLTDTASIGPLAEQIDAVSGREIACLATDAPEGTGGRGGASGAPGNVRSWDGPAPRPDELALLQFTSGSTSEPRGVMVTHAGLRHNMELIRRGTGVPDGFRMVSWLPLYHDMGLIGGVLTPLMSGGSSALMSPLSFVREPALWLERAGDLGVHAIVSPNFGYDLCLRRIDSARAAALDLSSVVTALNGAEPVDPATLSAFTDRFAPAGLAAEAVSPCYGMAEVGLYVTGSPAGERPVVRHVSADALERDRLVPVEADDADARELTSCGVVPRGFDTLIVSPGDGTALPDGRVGEIWLRGPSVARGYWGLEEESARVFAAPAPVGTGEPSGEGEGGFLRTGDLGVCFEGHLYVTGRLKELIIVRGRNIYPQDLERLAADAHPELSGASAAFAVPVDGVERVVVVHELDAANAGARPEELSALLMSEISGATDVPVDGVCFVAPGEIKRSTSGKIRRAHTRHLFVTGALGAFHESLNPALRETYRK